MRAVEKDSWRRWSAARRCCDQAAAVGGGVAVGAHATAAPRAAVAEGDDASLKAGSFPRA
jgi:hypothetical protein